MSRQVENISPAFLSQRLVALFVRAAKPFCRLLNYCNAFRKLICAMKVRVQCNTSVYIWHNMHCLHFTPPLYRFKESKFLLNFAIFDLCIIDEEVNDILMIVWEA